MAILGDEPNLFPESLLEDADQCSEVVPAPTGRPRQWWVIYTKARQEKALARCLFDSGIPFYLPLVPRNAIYHRHRVTSTSPLFTGYLFLCGTEEQRLVALATKRISQILSVDDPERLRRDLRQIQRLIAANAPLTIESRLASGARVRVKHGPLVGLEGTVLVRRGQTRLLVSVDFLQQGASVEIDDFLLEPVG
ncbi:MAG: antitermination protein NusG [Rhodopirellula sp.]|nr:antitermination protein NusG [Rhodopirellula sp.]